PVVLADQGEQSLAGDDPQPHPELVEDDQRRGREGEDPEQLVAVLGAEDRVGGDPGRVVIGETGQQARPDHGEQRRQAAAAQQQVAAAAAPPARAATPSAPPPPAAHRGSIPAPPAERPRARRLAPPPPTPPP